MTSRPIVSIFAADNSSNVQGSAVLPPVFASSIRPDIVSFVHTNLSKNSRQAHGVDPRAGHKHAAESWGTGRAVARIPRVSGSGTHRAGQAAFGNMCRKGRMFAPLKTWRRWHRKVNVNQRRHAVASALAASAISALVLARGHRIQNIPELPLVIENKIENYEKTKEAVSFLKRFGAYDDIEKVVDSKRLRAGKGKMRNRRFRIRKGPLLVYGNENVQLVKAFRNIPGVEVSNVHRLNLRQLAPGGHVGRFIVWTESAFKALDNIFGSYRKSGIEKSGYNLQKPVLSNADLARIINSNEVQEKLRPARSNQVLHTIQKKNPLRNKKAMEALNPNAKLERETAKKANEQNRQKRQSQLNQKRTAEVKKTLKTREAGSKKWIKNVEDNLNEAYNKDKAREDALHQAELGNFTEGIEEAPAK